MARKSRKHQTVTLPHLHSETAGYICLSVTGKDGDDSIENQKKVIEAWAQENQHPISRWYIDAGWSGRTFDRPKFRELIADIERGEVDCVVVKDLSRLGRDHIAVGYYLEVFFPMNCVRFVSINDYFDTVDGLTDQSNPHGSRIRIPIKNAFNEQVAAEIKQKVEATLQMKVERGTFIGPRAPFGYQKAEANPDQLVPDPIASITVRKIFDLAANGTGVTGIVRYLNERGLPTPIQYARSNGLTGSFADGTGDWNSRSVKYILTNRTYTGMLVQGKEKRVVKGTHEPLVDVETFDRIQSEFKACSFNVRTAVTMRPPRWRRILVSAGLICEVAAMTQCETILRHMEDCGSITSLEAMQEYGIMRLASRISDLKKAGIPIHRDMVSQKNRYGETVTFARYSIAER